MQERASAVYSVPVRTSCSPAAPGWESNTAEGGGATYGVTTNVSGASIGPLAGPDLSGNPAQSPAGRETGTDSAKQSQSGAVPIEANSFTDEGLHQEGWIVPAQEQSQFPRRGEDGNGVRGFFLALGNSFVYSDL